jgi:hypothetical protein
VNTADFAARMNRSSLITMLISSFVIPALLAFLILGMCGVGHGECHPMVLYPAIFPYSFVAGNLFKDNVVLLFAPALLQYPIYVLLLLWRARSRLVPFVLFVGHVVTALIGYWLMLG